MGVAFVFAIICAGAADKEPQYQGRSFSDWAKQLDPHSATIIAINGVPQPEPPVHTAIRSIGTNAIPILLKWIATKESAEHTDEPRPLAPCCYPSDSRRAVLVFGVLGGAAAPAIPQLTKLAMTHPDYKCADNSVEALTKIGPASLAAFSTILTNGPPGVRFAALDWLAAFGPDSAVLMPAVLKCMAGKDDEAADKAVAYFEARHASDAVTIPALTNALAHASAKFRVRICRSFFFMSYHQPDAVQPWQAVPALRVALKDPNHEVSQTASNALASIESHRRR